MVWIYTQANETERCWRKRNLLVGPTVPDKVQPLDPNIKGLVWTSAPNLESISCHETMEGVKIHRRLQHQERDIFILHCSHTSKGHCQNEDYRKFPHDFCITALPSITTKREEKKRKEKKRKEKKRRDPRTFSKTCCCSPTASVV
jgi:hypothetical protein